MFFHPGGGMATSTYLSAPPPEQYERALQGHRTRRTLCDVPVSVPNTDELYCSIPKIKVNRPKGPPAKKKTSYLACQCTRYQCTRCTKKTKTKSAMLHTSLNSFLRNA